MGSFLFPGLFILNNLRDATNMNDKQLLFFL